MNKTFASLAAAVIVSLGTSLAAAQADAIVLAPEVRTTFHQHVTATNLAPAMVDTHLVVGGVVPAGIILHPVPPVVIARAPELAGHRFVVANDRIHIVHPETRAIVTVID
jgi:hypothetical protein